MPMEKDPERRRAILDQSKKLFAARGFHATSVNDVARSLEIPIGSLYTYFRSKDEILETIIEEGWGEFILALETRLAAEASARAKIDLIVEVFLPQLFADADLISILFSEGARMGKFAEKLEYLASLLSGLINEAELGLDQDKTKVALLVFLLGSLDAVRLSRGLGLSVTESDVLGFIRALLPRAFPSAQAGSLPSA
jgi:AcrR family transcriptional regulator